MPDIEFWDALTALLIALGSIITTVGPILVAMLRRQAKRKQTEDDRYALMQSQIETLIAANQALTKGAEELRNKYMAQVESNNRLLEQNNLLKDQLRDQAIKLERIPVLEKQLEDMGNRLYQVQAELKRLSDVEQRAQDMESQRDAMRTERDIALARAQVLQDSFDAVSRIGDAILGSSERKQDTEVSQ